MIRIGVVEQEKVLIACEYSGRVRESFRNFQQTWNNTVQSPPNVYGDNNLPTIKGTTEGVSPSFLTLEQ